MKIAIVGDPHLQEKTPRARIDEDYLGTCLDEIDAISQLADVVVFLGDLLNRPSLSNVAELRILQFFLERGGSDRFYSIIGNHDIYGMNLEDGYRRSKLSILEEADAVKIVRNFEVIGDTTFRVIPMERGPFDPAAMDPAIQGDEIVLAHYFFNKSVDPPMTITADMLMCLPPAVYFFGHDHEPEPPFYLDSISEVGGTVYRPGALARDSAQPYNLSRVPVFYQLDEESGEIKEVPVPCVPSVDLFDPVVIENNKSRLSLKRESEELLLTLDSLVEGLSTPKGDKVTIFDALTELETPPAELEYLKSVLLH